MDIDLLSKIVKEIILDNDSVTLPGIGSFMAEIVPSSFSDRGYTINPPYRRLYFTRKEGTDTLLVDFYASSNSVSRDDATRIIVTFLSEMKDVLKDRKTVQFPGLGRLRATRENNFFFIPDEDLDIYPAGFGLAPISLKTHEETEDEVSAAVASLASAFEEPVTEEPMTEEPKQEESVAEEPVAEEPVIAAPVAEEPVVEEPIPEESKPVEPVAEVPKQPERESESQETPKSEVTKPQPKPESQRQHHHHHSHHHHHHHRTPEPAPEPPARRSGWFWKALLIFLVLAVIVVAAYAVVARVNPAFVDRFLYNAEELEIIKQMNL